MGIITVSLDDDIENLIRKEAARKYGHRKGALKQFISEAALEYAEEEKNKNEREDEIAKEQMALGKRGFDIGYKYTPREKLWGRY